MSKVKALWLAIGSIVLVAVFMVAQQVTCMYMFVIFALVFGAIAFYKYARDARIVNQAETEQLQAADRLPLPPQMTSKGSSRLFVPPPLDKH